MAANEASAVESLRTLNTVCIQYSTTYGGYPPALSNLGPATPATPAKADLIDSVLASGNKSGYGFAYAVGSTDSNGTVLSYSIAAAPISPGTTGQRYFFTDQSGVIRANPTGLGFGEQHADWLELFHPPIYRHLRNDSRCDFRISRACTRCERECIQE